MSSTDLQDRYFDAAFEILATDGYGALKLAAVCKHLNVTTGAFYHAFESWGDFTTALLRTWRRDRTTLIAEVARGKTDPVEMLEALLAATLDLRHGSEAAIRVWAAVDPDVAKVQRLVDAEREEIVLAAMEQLVGPVDGPRFARWGLNVLIGYEVATGDQDPSDLEWQLRQILEIAAGRGRKR